MKEITIQSIVREWLECTGYDGLFSPMLGCACDHTDLMPCGEPMPDCQAGTKAPCTGDDCEMGGGCEFHIVPRKPKF